MVAGHGERIWSLTAPVRHGCVFVRAVESKETHDGWDPATSLVSAAADSVFFAVLPEVDGDVEFELWRGEPDRRLPVVMHEGSMDLMHGAVVFHDPDDEFKLEVSGLGRGGPLSVLADDGDFPAHVQIVFQF
jgi:hypothetical protein